MKVARHGMAGALQSSPPRAGSACAAPHRATAGRSVSTLARALNRLGLSRLKNLARFRKVGHRMTGNRQQGRSYRVGCAKVHVAIDDATRLACVEGRADEQKTTAIGVGSRAVA